MSIHSIRLAGPWELQAGSADPVRVQLPSDVPSNGQLIRKFHRPSGLDDGTEVRVELAANGAQLIVKLNDQVLSPVSESPLQFDITSQLQSFNSLCMRAADGEALVLQSAVLLIVETE